MTEIRKVFKVGNSVAVTIPSKFGAIEGDQIVIEGNRDEMRLRRVKL